MPQWSVTLNGDLTDLKALADLGVGVTKEGDAYVFRSPDFDGLTDARAVHQYAVERVEVFKGLSRMAVGDQMGRVITVGGITRDDGSIEARFLIPATGGLKLQGRAADLRGPGDSGPPPNPFPARAAVAQRDPAVWQALHYFAAPVSPSSLWKVYEVIRDDAGGKEGIVNEGWATDDDIERFRSVHYPSVFGANARHGVEDKGRPAPRDPMSLAEAQEFVTSLLEKWLASKERAETGRQGRRAWKEAE